jgi:hypothetical protein
MEMTVFKGSCFSGGYGINFMGFQQQPAYFIRLDQELMNGYFSELVFQRKDFIYSTLTIQR